MDNFTGYYLAHQLGQLSQTQETLAKKQKEDNRIQRRDDQIMQLRIEIATSKDKGEPTNAKEEILNSLLEDVEREKILDEIRQCCVCRSQEDEIICEKARVYVQEHHIDCEKSSIEKLRQLLDYFQHTREAFEANREQVDSKGLSRACAIILGLVIIGVIVAIAAIR